MATLATPLSQEFNKFYTDILNCEVVAPPYYPGRVPQTFFFKKRGGLSAYADGPDAGLFDEIFDELLIDDDVYTYGRLGTDFKVYKNNNSLIFSQGGYDPTQNITYKIFAAPSAAGAQTSVITSTNSSGTTIEANLPGTTLNQYAGKYIYLYDAVNLPVWQGQVRQITQNTAGPNVTFTVAAWTLQPGSPTTFRIFDEWRPVPMWITNDGLWVNNDGVLNTFASQLGNLLDCVYTRGRLFLVNSSKNIIATGRGFDVIFVSSAEDYIGTVNDFLNIVDFQNYILVLGKNEMNNIQEDTVTVSGDTEVTYKLVNLTQTIGIWMKNSFVVYNQGLYIVSNRKRFQTVTITPAGTDKYVVELKDQGIYIQKFLDNITDTDIVGVALTDSEIYIFINTASGTTIHTFDLYYQGWHRWTTTIKLTGFKFHFLGYSRLIIKSNTEFDADDSTYEQSMEQVIGESELFQNKRHYFIKVYLGQDTSQDIDLEFTSNLGSTKFVIDKSLSDAGYLTSLSVAQDIGTLGNNVLGLAMLGDSGSYLAGVADVTSIEIPTGFLYEIGIIKLKADGDNRFECGGFLHEYAVFNPAVTAYYNTI